MIKQNKIRKPSILLVCYVNAEIGIGHLSRLLTIAETLKKDNKVIPEFLIFGELIKKNKLCKYKVYNFPFLDDFSDTIKNILKVNNFDSLIFDLHSKHNIENLGELFIQLRQDNIALISVDSLLEFCDILNLIWIPSFNFESNKYINCKSILKSGWDSLLIQKHFKHKDWSPGVRVLILTGGSDVSNLGEFLPTEIDQLLAKNSEINWVRGPFASMPNLPNKCRLKWIIHNAPEQLDELIVQSDYVMTVFGVSFFEVLQYGIPSVVFSPYGNKDNSELNALFKEDVAMVVNNPNFATEALVELMNNHEIAKVYSMNALKKMANNGTQNFSKEIYSLIESK